MNLKYASQARRVESTSAVSSSEQTLEDVVEAQDKTTSIPKSFGGFPVYSLDQLYRLPLRKEKAGGEGTVYRAITLDGETVAVKEINEKWDDDLHKADTIKGMTRFKREISGLKALGGRGVTPKIKEAFLQSDSTRGSYIPTISMEWLCGRTLGQLQQEGYRFTEEKVLDLLSGVLPQLAEIHKEALIHRDLSPENVLLVAETITSKPEDYGILDLASSTDSKKQTRTVAIGTNGYIAPEQLNGQRELSYNADIYSLGKIALGLLVEEPSAKLADVLDRMTKEDNLERYQRVTDVLADLQRIRTVVRTGPGEISEVVEGNDIAKNYNEDIVPAEYRKIIMELAKKRLELRKEVNNLEMLADNYDSVSTTADYIKYHQKSEELEELDIKFVKELINLGYTLDEGCQIPAYKRYQPEDNRWQVLIETKGENKWFRNKAFNGYTYAETKEGESVDGVVGKIVKNSYGDYMDRDAVEDHDPMSFAVIVPLMAGTFAALLEGYFVAGVIYGIGTIIGSYLRSSCKKSYFQKHEVVCEIDDQNNYKAIDTALKPAQVIKYKESTKGTESVGPR